MSSSIRKWVEQLPWMQQGVLFAVIRGCDGFPKEDVNKIIIRGYRHVILKSARKDGHFLSKTPSSEKLVQCMKEFVDNTDQYPMHFVTHLMLASEIVGYKHPIAQIRIIWRDFYLSL